MELALTEGPDSPVLVPGAGYTLCPRFTDFNTDRVCEELREIDETRGSAFVELITDPATFANGPVDPVGAMARDLASAQDMTDSQLNAFIALCERRLGLVWGPPGTGKTHFLASAILSLAEANRREARSMRVVVTAFTHAAINNLLRKISELQAERRIYSGDLGMAKATREPGGGDWPGTELHVDAANDWVAGRGQAILGATVWALRRTDPEWADMVVIDEGSQVKVPDSAIAIRRMAPQGRLLDRR